jgi:hypothetical protein
MLQFPDPKDENISSVYLKTRARALLFLQYIQYKICNILKILYIVPQDLQKNIILAN